MSETALSVNETALSETETALSETALSETETALSETETALSVNETALSETETALSDTDRYTGLNLPDLMELMHGVVYPEPISLFPETIGWQLLGLWLMACICLVVFELAKRYRANRYRREAIRLVESVELEHTSAPQQLATLVKRTAMAAFPRSQVASMTGPDWQRFLQQTSNHQLSADEAKLLTTAAYDPSSPNAEVHDAAIRWIRSHRA